MMSVLAQLPSSSTWGQQSNSGACQSQTTLSLAEIQKLEEERERQLREEVNTDSSEVQLVRGDSGVGLLSCHFSY